MYMNRLTVKQDLTGIYFMEYHILLSNVLFIVEFGLMKYVSNETLFLLILRRIIHC